MAAITYSGSTATTASQLSIGNTSTTNGTLTLNGSGVTGNLILANTTTNSTTLRIRSNISGINTMALSLTNAVGEVNVSVGNSILIGNLSSQVAISGSGGIVKTGGGFLNLSTVGTYTGNTAVNGGTLLVSGDNSAATGAVTVANTASFGGTGTVGGATTVQSGGRIFGGTGSSTDTLTVRNVTIQNGGILFANLGASGTNSTLSFAGNSLDFKTGSVLRLDDAGGFTSSGTFNLATFTNGNTLLVNATATNDGDILGEYLAGTGNVNGRPVTLDVSSLPTLTAGDRLTLRRGGNNLSLVFTPVPEPATMLAVCGLAVGGVAAARLRRKGASVTSAA